MDNNLDQSKDFLFYSSNDGRIKVQVIVDGVNDTILTTQKGMSEIFGVDVRTISYHLKSIFQSKELIEEAVIQKNWITASDGKRYLTSIYKLVERIQEIRASERMFYDKITDIFKDCSIDYDPKSLISRRFYAAIQNKFHYAIHQHTAAEILCERADSSKPYMGLTNWKSQKKGGKIYKSDVIKAKNYLSEDEIKSLNRLVNMFLDYAEHLAEKGKGEYKMADWAKRLEMFLNFNEYPVLTNAGKVKADIAKHFAEIEYDKFRVIQDREYKSDFNRLIEASHNGLPTEERNG